MSENIAIKEKEIEPDLLPAQSGQQVLIAPSKLPIAKHANDLRAEKEMLAETDLAVEHSYEGWRGYWRLFQVSSVIGKLALLLYLNQLDTHIFQQKKQAEGRLKTAKRLTWMAVIGENVHGLNLWFFQQFLYLLRRFSLGSEENKEAIVDKQATWLKSSLIKLGPTFIKIGQSLGTRADLLPLSFVKALGELQDSVPPFPNEIAFARIEKELGKKITEVYAEFDLEPVAAASLGQVYRAKLFSGEEVAVKVQRPNLEGIIKGDIALLRKIVGYAERFPSLNENADWAGMLREFDETVHEEMDYVKEGHNADKFRESFKDWSNIHVPTIYWDATTPKVITMEFINGDKVIDLTELRGRGISPEEVNRLLIKTYLKQLLEDGFFHADPHPGNLLVMPDGRLAFFDFGMVGRISPKLQAKMIDAFFHVVAKEPELIAQDLIDLEFLKPGADETKIKEVVVKMFSLHLDLKLKDVKFTELTYDLADVMYDYPFRLPSNFTYIMRALMTLEGIGIITDPEFNFFETAKPFAKEFMLRREGKDLRKLLVDKFLGRETDEVAFDLDRTWKLAKMAAKTIFNFGGK